MSWFPVAFRTDSFFVLTRAGFVSIAPALNLKNEAHYIVPPIDACQFPQKLPAAEIKFANPNAEFFL